MRKIGTLGFAVLLLILLGGCAKMSVNDERMDITEIVPTATEVPMEKTPTPTEKPLEQPSVSAEEIIEKYGLPSFEDILNVETLSIEEIWQIEDEYDFVYEMNMYIGEKCGYGSNLDALSEPERVFYTTQYVEMEVNNGGLWQFFYNADDSVYSEAYAAFSAIGAEKTADIYREATKALGQEMPADRASRIELLMKLGIEKGYEVFSPFDEAFYSYEEDLSLLNYAYIQNNKDAFS